MSLSYFTNFARTKYVIRFLTLTVMGLLAVTSLGALPPSPEVIKMFPLDLGGFHQVESVRPLLTLAKDGVIQPEYLAPITDPGNPSPILAAEAEYLSAKGDKLLVEIVRAQNDSDAYSLYTLARKKMRETESADLKRGSVGTESVVTARVVAFFKGTTFARVTNENGRNSEPANELALLLAGTFDKGEDDIPVLVKHLPDWQASQRNAIYAVNIGTLRDAIPNQPVLNELSFDGGTEAVTASYGQSQLVIVEFTTPQLSIDNDNRIWTKIKELKSQGQPAPTAYRRVGNYSVFVFNAPDEKTANALVDQVKYEQVVQWLGDDPHMADRLQRYFSGITSGVLVAVLKSSGLSLVFCLGLGGLIGALLFRHRRAQKAALYSDAGGATRLNLDELTGTSNSQRLLKSGKQPGAES